MNRILLRLRAVCSRIVLLIETKLNCGKEKRGTAGAAIIVAVLFFAAKTGWFDTRNTPAARAKICENILLTLFPVVLGEYSCQSLRNL